VAHQCQPVRTTYLQTSYGYAHCPFIGILPASRCLSFPPHERFEVAIGVNGPQLIECRVATPKEWYTLEELIHQTQ
jgi:hypothetical protein